MKPPLNDDELRRLGVGDYKWSTFSRVTVADTTPRGYARSPATSLAIMIEKLFTDQTAAEIDAPAAASLGVHVKLFERAPHIVMLSAPTELPVSFESLSQDSDTGLYIDPDDPATAYADLQVARAVRVAVAEDTLVVWIDGNSICFQVAVADRVQVDPLAEVDAPVEEWLRDCSDQWLAAQVRERLAVADPWEHIVAAGLYARLLETSPERRAGDAESVLAGSAPAEIMRPLMWAHNLEREQIDTLRRLARAEIELISQDIEALAEHGDLFKSVWRDSLLDLCHRRDDVECVWRLLPGDDDTLAVDLAELDEQGERFIIASPVRIEIPDERLWRVRLSDPEAWWTWIAIQPDADD